MAINYKKCTKCGSINVINILYGMPTHEAFLMAEKGKIKLGGCGITFSDPQYYCKDCENEWSREEAVDHEYNQIIGIEAEVGGFFSGNHKVEINFERNMLKWSNFNDKGEKVLTKSQVDSFKEDLKNLSLLNWKLKYVEPDILDGTDWKIDIIREGRHVKKHGSNQFPNEWEEFCKLITDLSGESFG